MKQIVDAVESLGKKIDKLAADSYRPVTPSLHPATPIAPVLNSTRSIKRRRIDAQSRPTVQAPANCGTNQIDLSDLSVPVVTPAPTVKFWLYLSKLNPLISDSDVKMIVSRCLKTTEPGDVVRLVPKGKDVSTMSFVSFKIGLDPELRNAALNPSSWPSGILFREFINQPKNYQRVSADSVFSLEDAVPVEN